MHYKFTESSFEEVVLKLFEEADYEYVSGYDIHRLKNDIILEDDFINYLELNYPRGNFSSDDIRIILNELKMISYRNLHTSFKETLNKVRSGFTLYRENENPIHIDFINFADKNKNSFKVVNQFEVQGSQELRRPDIVIFINGIPISVIELKNPADETVSVFQAYEDLTIKCNRGISDLMRYSFVAMISDNANTKVGSIFAGYEHFYEWKSTDGNDYAETPFEVLEMTIKGLYKHETILNIIENYVYVPESDDGKSTVIVPKYYQYYHTEVLYNSVKAAMKPNGDGKGGTYFGATGSGKSYIMLYLTRRLTLDTTLDNPTVLLITDRGDLDDQLSKTFAKASTFLNDKNVRSFESREDLRDELNGIKSGGVFLTTVQKFNEETSLLTNRNNVICISDEAHRSQINLNEVLELSNDEIVKRVGFAKHLRDALPNATYVGFTGTPIDETIGVFGEVAASYQMRRAKQDGSTVGLEYVPGPDELKLDEQKIREIEKFYDEMEQIGTNEYQIEKSKKESANVKTIVNNPKRLKNVARHFVALYEKRVEEAATVNGKAMFICYDREVAFNFYNELKDLRPEWFVKKASAEGVEVKEEDKRELLPLEMVQLVATRAARDKKELYDLLGTKTHRETLAKEFKKVESNFKIAILVDMWITGFDVPSLDTIYIDKPLHRHSLIQTVSRVNRIFKGKEKGVIVDYIGIKTALAKALKQYGGDIPAIEQNIQVAIQIFKDQLSLIKEMFHEFDLSDFYSEDKVTQLRLVNKAANYISTTKENERKFMNHTKALKSALDICVGSSEITEEEIVEAHIFFIIRSIIYKLNSEGTPDVEKMNRHVKKLVDEALESEIDLDNLDSVERTDLFSDEYLDTIKNIKYPTTKLKALLYLLKKIVGKYKQVNIIKGMEFEERLKQLVHKYNNRDQLVFAGAVMDEVIESITKEIENTIKEVQVDAKSFEKLGISFEEKAFYDILKNIRDKTPFEYEEDRLIKLAKAIKKVVDNQTKYTDFDKREDIRNALRSDIIRTLSKHGYPPVTATEVYDKVFETAQNFKKYN